MKHVAYFAVILTCVFVSILVFRTSGVLEQITTLMGSAEILGKILGR